MKEIRFRPRIHEHDLQVKIRNIRRLVIKDAVRVSVLFRGREVSHPEFGRKIITRVIQETSDIAKVEARNDKGNMYFIILVNGNKKTLPTKE